MLHPHNYNAPLNSSKLTLSKKKKKKKVIDETQKRNCIFIYRGIWQATITESDNPSCTYMRYSNETAGVVVFLLLKQWMCEQIKQAQSNLKTNASP